MSRFENKVALVTGGGSGIGEAVALELASEGASVVVVDLNLAGAQKVVDRIVGEGGKAVAFEGDAANPGDNEASVDLAVTTYGALHLAVNNAGIGGEAGPAGEVSIEGWLKVINVNLNGVFYGMRYQIPAMLEAGGGSIVNLSSIHGSVATPFGGNSAYTAAKHGVVGLTKNAANEYGAKGIRINAIGPAYIETPLLGGLQAEIKAELIKNHPIGRLGRAEEVSALATFLLSDAASFITGSYHLVDGGYTAR